jgi:hypothetical protein
VRRRVAAVSLATFALSWGVIAGSGSMGAETPTTSTTASSTVPSSSSTSDVGDRDRQRQRPVEPVQLEPRDAAVLMLALAAETHVFWITSRAAGVVALLLASLSVCVGLSIGGRMLPSWLRDARALHEALSLATIAALLVHVVSLLGDSFMQPSIVDLTVPFASSFGARAPTRAPRGSWR